MKFKRLLLVISLMTVLGLSPCAGQGMDFSTSSPLTQQIESEKSYPGVVVQELIDAVWAAAAVKIASSYDEGYKAGMLDSYPGEAYWSSLAESMRQAAERQANAPGWGAVIGVSAGALILGFSAGVVTCAALFVK